MTHDPRACPWTAADETHLLTWPDPQDALDGELAHDWDGVSRLRIPLTETRVVNIPAPRGSQENAVPGTAAGGIRRPSAVRNTAPSTAPSGPG